MQRRGRDPVGGASAQGASIRAWAGQADPAEVELFKALQDGAVTQAHLVAEVRRIEAEARSWATRAATDHGPVGQDFAALWLRDVAELRVLGMTEPHPYIKITFIYRPTRQKIAHPVPLVGSDGARVDAPLMDLQEVLDTEDLGVKGRLSYPDADGYRWLHA